MINKLLSNKYFKNSSWLLLEKVYRFAIGFFVSIWIVRYLGPTNFGILSYIQNIIAILAVFVSLGLDGIVLREIVKYPSRKHLYLSISLISSFIVSLLLVVAVFIIQKYINSDKYFLLFILSIGLIFESFSIFRVYFQEKILSKYEVISNLASLTIGSFIKVYLLLNSYELLYFIMAIVFEKAIYSLSLYLFFKKQENNFKFQYDTRATLNLIKQSWPLIFSTLSYIVYTRTDQIMIEHFLGSYEVGIYSAAVRLYEIPFMITTIISGTLTPVLYRKFNENKKEFFELTLKILSYMSLLAYIIIAIYIFFGKDIILLLFGEKYLQSYEVLSLLSFVILVHYISFLRSSYLISIEEQKLFLYINIVSVAINIILNYIFIPIYGVEGAAVATLLSRLYTLVIYMVFKNTRKYSLMQLKSLFIFGIFTRSIKNEC